MAFYINITQFYMCAGNKLELLMTDALLTGVYAKPVLTIVEKSVGFLNLLLMPANDLQSKEEIPLIRLQGHQFVLCLNFLLGTWLGYL